MVHENGDTILFKQSIRVGYLKFLKKDSECLRSAIEYDQLTIYCSIETVLMNDVFSNNIGNVWAGVPPYNEELFDNSEFCDRVFLIDDKMLRAHEAVLAVSSPVFASLLTNDWKRTKNGVIEIEDFSFATMQELLRYIYTGKVKNSKNVAHELFLIADKYDIKKLKGYCKAEFCIQINLDNAWTWLEMAENCQVDQLKKNVIKYVLSNKEEATKQLDFLKICSTVSHLLIDIFKFSEESNTFSNARIRI